MGIKEEVINETACQSGCSCGHHHAKQDNRKIINIIIFLFIYLAVAFFVTLPYQLEGAFYLAGYLFIGGPVLLRASKNILKGQVFDENTLMTLATIGALSIGRFAEAVAVMLFYQIGQYLEDKAVNRSRRSIRAILDIKPEYANLIKGNEVMHVDPAGVSVGDIILVKPGERIPLDGKIIDGQSVVDTSAITGESIPRYIKNDDQVLSGFINKNGMFRMIVEKEYSNSMAAKILDLVQNASSKKAGTERFISRFARYYTPAVMIAAAMLALIPPLLWQESFADWFYRALVFLVVSCPCALVISIPLSYFGGIGAAARKGILIKGANHLEALNKVKTVVFDKTGTLTRGVFKISRIVPCGGFSKEQVLEYAALAESCSTHPLAKSVLEAYDRQIPGELITSYEEQPGLGVKVTAQGNTILAGSEAWLEMAGLTVLCREKSGTAIHLAVNNEYAGCLLASDELKADSRRAFRSLRKMGVEKLVVLTGDTEEATALLTRNLEFDDLRTGLLPQEKVEAVEELLQAKNGGKLVFVGDGINDAPVLARADLGVAMGAMGSDAAVEAADVVLMTDEPPRLCDAIRIARRTQVVVWQNIGLALGLKSLILLMGAAGIATMWSAIFADVGVTILAVLNSLRTMLLPAAAD